jgi:anthranilate phosphoribosyltransferase
VNLKNCLEKLMQKQDLDGVTSQHFLETLLNPDVNSSQAAACLVLLRAKNETAEELAGMVSVLQNRMTPVHTSHRILDIVGTGGDGFNTVNLSTGSALLAASCGIKVLKHGNRAVTSMAGSADVLEALGVALDPTPEQVVESIEQFNIGFCFAPAFHSALRQLRLIRQQLNVPTTFNLLGPLLNPAKPEHLLVGVFHESLLEPMAYTLQKMGTVRSMVVHGCGLDELSCAGTARVIEVTRTATRAFSIDPEHYGLTSCTLDDLRGGNARKNAQLLSNVFTHASDQKNRPIADSLILNAGVALYLYGLHASIEEGVAHAQENLLSGAVAGLLDKWRRKI